MISISWDWLAMGQYISTLHWMNYIT